MLDLLVIVVATAGDSGKRDEAPLRGRPLVAHRALAGRQ
jgi:hypothetical protein